MQNRNSIIFGLVVAAISQLGQVNAQPCAPTQCSESHFDPNLTINPLRPCYNDTDTVTLSCSGKLGGPPFNACNNGNWTHPSASCEVFTCQQPTLGEHMNVIPVKATYDARETIDYICNQGYELIGAETTTCDQQDTWNPSTVPTCLESCEVPVIDNGDLIHGGPFVDGDNVEVQCDDGYSIETGFSSVISCTEGEWGAIPRCLGSKSCSLSAVPRSSETSSRNVTHGTVFSINCWPSYSFNLETSFTVSCDDGTLTGTVPPACYEDCAILSPPANGDISTGNLHGQTVYYSCDRGFALNGTSSATCSDGNWSEDTPWCTGQSPEDSITLYCNPDKYIVEIPGVLLGDNPGLDSIVLGTCSGTYYDGEYLYVNSSYTDCETTVAVDQTAKTVIYRNTLRSIETGPVTTERYIEISIECVFDQNKLVSSSAIVQGTVIKALADNSQYDVSFGAYVQSDFTVSVTGALIVDTNSYIYILSEVDHVTEVDLFPTRCYATPQPESNYFQYHDLIDNGCPESSYVDELRSDATSKPNIAFRIRVFRFTNSDSDSIYIHCELKVCPVGGCPLTTPCSARKRRSSQINFTKHVTVGPIKMRHEEAVGVSSFSWQLTALTVYGVITSTLLLAVVLIVAVVIARRFRTKTTRKGNLREI